MAIKIIFLVLFFSCSTTSNKNISISQKFKDIKNSSWQSDKVEEKRTFKEGSYEFETKINGESCATCIEKAKMGTIAIDSEDAVAIIYSETGGSGTFVYLNLYINKNGKMIQSGYPISLGDRVKVQKVSLSNKKVVVHLLTHASGEPLCCPNTKEVWEFKVENGNLKKIKK